MFDNPDEVRKRAIKAHNDVARQIGMDVPEEDEIDIDIVVPQFEREEDFEVADPPESIEGFEALREKSIDELQKMGLRKWSDEDGLMLLPHEWYDDIPEGLEVTSINGETLEFDTSTHLKEMRFGVLPYGIEADDE